MRTELHSKVGSRAFTLTEVLLAATIMTVAVAAVLSVFVSVNRSRQGLSDAIDLNARSRLIQDRIVLDVRSLTTVTTIGAQSFSGTFIDFGSASTSSTTATITYTLSNGTLQRTCPASDGTIQTTVVMRDLLTDPTQAACSSFEFYNRNGNATTAVNSVRSIRFRLVPAATARQTLGLVSGKNDPFCSALIQLRNLLPLTN
jgi:type II secretory pathway pseudopilin PulG